MKVTYHIPTEQYGYVEIEKEWNGSDEDAIEGYKALRSPELPSGEGLDQKTWNRVLEEYLNTGSLVDGTNLYEQMSTIQKTVMQEIKKCFKRMKAHLPEEIKE